MREAVLDFLSSLDGAQRQAATYPFADEERRRWQYTPGPRGGLALADMEQRQSELAMALLDAGLSQQGAATARGIIRLEPILKRIEVAAGRAGSERRDERHYWFSVFGDPSAGKPWAWRVGGHHLCLHFTVVAERVAVTPLFFGANPARVPSGPEAGLRVLGPEEDLAREFLATLDDDARDAAVVSAQAPADILTGNAVRAEVADVPTGLDCSALDTSQARALARLLDRYRHRVPQPPVWDVAELHFAWAGSTEPGRGHYYAIRGGSLLVEYDNTQNDANHVHTVWRDLSADWGEDLLAAHYRQAHR